MVMIPIAGRIEDKSPVDAILYSASSNSNVILADVDALWHWEVIIKTTDSLMANESITFFLVLVEEANIIWTNYTSDELNPVIYGLRMSAIFSDAGTFTVISNDTTVCTNCSVYTVIEDGYYKVYNNNSTSVQYNLRYVSSDDDYISCKLNESASDCELVFDKIDPYYVIADYNSSVNNNITLNITENGRRTWYTFIIILFLPIVISTVALVITIICIKVNYCSHTN